MVLTKHALITAAVLLLRSCGALRELIVTDSDALASSLANAPADCVVTRLPPPAEGGDDDEMWDEEMHNTNEVTLVEPIRQRRFSLPFL